MAKERVHTVAFPWSAQVWIITSLYFVFSLCLIAFMVYFIATTSVVAGVVGLVVALPILLGILLYCEGYSPQRLEVSDNRITILRRYDSITLLRSTILEIHPIAKREMGFVVSCGGCGGLFGFFGTFRSSRLGQFKMYATGDDNLFILRLANGDKIVVQCVEPQILV